LDEEQNPDSKPTQYAGNSSSSGPITKVIGLKEGQWLRQWEGSIRRAVTSRLQGPLTVLDPPNGVALLLDGYADAE
jgi:hypothetical protein